MAKMDILMRAERVRKDVVISISTSSRTSRLLSTSKVDVFNQAKVQGANSTYRMLYLIEEIITKSNFVSVCLLCATNYQSLLCGGLLENMGFFPHCQVNFELRFE